MAAERCGWAERCLAVAAKDLRSELRRRYAVNALGMFALTCVAVVSFSIGPFGVAEADRPFLFSVLIWLCVFFTAMTGLARVFVKEEESGTAPGLRLAATPGVVFAGKLLFNAALLAAVDLVVVPLFAVAMEFPMARPGAFAGVVALGSVALLPGTTLVAAIAAKAGARGGLFGVLGFPIVFPVLATAIHACSAAAAGGSPVGPDLVRLGTMAVVSTVVAAALFPWVWES